ncbi:DUF2806 domain-containing protein [Acinetobacter sp. ANC 5414]|uniref:DUF2806 domain-containing protein n=1 Tax=Acinetobacter sp. ANC 5414 TaxID=2731251 RepID=UPI0014904331|nr:DUF2806 domain-containing protein [Acinetobacter sp. ANC 5414]NNH02021.1 DUF2806 domain-containing protein [Acinetobacter sp. ANC 5414]
MEQEVIKAATGVATTAANKGIRKLTNLLFSKKLREDKRLDDLSAAQTKKDIELIENGLAEFRDGKFLLIEDQIGNPTSPLGLILAQNHQNQSKNLGKCLSKAYEHLSKKADEEISDEQISETFFNKWMNYGKEVSEEELQDLWGKILSEEISIPNSINYLLLHTLSMMSKRHLEVFNDLLPYMCKGVLFCNEFISAEMNYPHIPENFLNELVDLNLIKGLMTADINFWGHLKNFRYDGNIYPLIQINSRNIIILHLIDETKPVHPHFFILTTIGEKLLNMAIANRDINEYFIDLTNNIKTMQGFKNIKYFELFTLIDECWIPINRN